MGQYLKVVKSAVEGVKRGWQQPETCPTLKEEDGMNDYDFVKESNRIEGIVREPTDIEMEEFHRFMDLGEIILSDMTKFVSAYQPDAELRDRVGLDVYVGSYVPPSGGVDVKLRLIDILNDANEGADPYETHIRYEKLHPFTDGNGRSGRMLWAWQMKDISLGFLHMFYYQTLRRTQ